MKDPTMMVPFNRREFLRNSSLGFGALALGDLLTAESRAADAVGNPLAARPPNLPGTARSVIFLFMQGGPKASWRRSIPSQS
jgi:hypothetical protein